MLAEVIVYLVCLLDGRWNNITPLQCVFLIHGPSQNHLIRVAIASWKGQHLALSEY